MIKQLKYKIISFMNNLNKANLNTPNIRKELEKVLNGLPTYILNFLIDENFSIYFNLNNLEVKKSFVILKVKVDLIKKVEEMIKVEKPEKIADDLWCRLARLLAIDWVRIKNEYIPKNMVCQLNQYPSISIILNGATPPEEILIVKKDIADYVYLGSVKNSKRHGQGIMMNKNGNIYEGEFYNNKFDGYGKLKNTDEGIYEGQFKKGKFHGKGLYNFFDGDIYEGEFKNGEFHGQGYYKFSNGSHYQGAFKNGKRHGHGIYKNNNNDVYEGEFKNGEFIPEIANEENDLELWCCISYC